MKVKELRDLLNGLASNYDDLRLHVSYKSFIENEDNDIVQPFLWFGKDQVLDLSRSVFEPAYLIESYYRATTHCENTDES